jgi:hypothetical protein
MAIDDEYELMPHREIAELKKELQRLKEAGQSPSGRTLQGSIDNLAASVNSMVNLFNEATKEIKVEEHDEQAISNKLEALAEAILVLKKQNEKIAEGIVALADMIKESKGKPKEELKPIQPKNPPAPGTPLGLPPLNIPIMSQETPLKPQPAEQPPPTSPSLGPTPPTPQKQPAGIQPSAPPQSGPLPPFPPPKKRGLFGRRK